MKNLVWRIRNGFAVAIILGLVVGFSATMAADPAAAEMQATKYEGYLADVLCATRGTALDGADMKKHPEKHSVECLKEPPCIASGFGVLTKGKDDTYGFHKFDKKGNEMAVELINKTKKQDNFSVEVTGHMRNGVIGVERIVEK